MKNKTTIPILLVGVSMSAANKSEGWEDIYEADIRRTVGGNRDTLPILVYDRDRMDISLMEIEV
jgi:hypothetical protein